MLEWASKELQSNKTIALAAVKTYTHAIKYMSKELKLDKNIYEQYLETKERESKNGRSSCWKDYEDMYKNQ